MDPHSVISLTFTVYSLSGRDLWTSPLTVQAGGLQASNQISADLRTVGWDEIEFFYEQ